MHAEREVKIGPTLRHRRKFELSSILIVERKNGLIERGGSSIFRRASIVEIGGQSGQGGNGKGGGFSEGVRNKEKGGGESVLTSCGIQSH